MMKAKKSMDKQLLGTWRSDRRRTMKDFVFRKKPTTKQRKFLTKLFGRLEIKWGRAKFRTELKGFKCEGSYRVLGFDSNSIAVFAGPRRILKSKFKVQNSHLVNKLLETKSIQHIHFEDDFYWILIGSGLNREWFKKIK